jgi:hypothetical protein
MSRWKQRYIKGLDVTTTHLNRLDEQEINKDIYAMLLKRCKTEPTSSGNKTTNTTNEPKL